MIMVNPLTMEKNKGMRVEATLDESTMRLLGGLFVRREHETVSQTIGEAIRIQAAIMGHLSKGSKVVIRSETGEETSLDISDSGQTGFLPKG